ncbi:hypothetical protein Y1Q_0008574 [Alligator mississippiensis]|uniref:Uncharacterized protein n=1 Tax=Alligator mississippiensis TaxID=8496 RepID=A0A151NR83_ALLMI|nr:hypothetical protein Y1Q_0008574 [Alligator mississippiensis]
MVGGQRERNQGQPGGQRPMGNSERTQESRLPTCFTPSGRASLEDVPLTLPPAGLLEGPVAVGVDGETVDGSGRRSELREENSGKEVGSDQDKDPPRWQK